MSGVFRLGIRSNSFSCGLQPDVSWNRQPSNGWIFSTYFPFDSSVVSDSSLYQQVKLRRASPIFLMSLSDSALVKKREKVQFKYWLKLFRQTVPTVIRFWRDCTFFHSVQPTQILSQNDSKYNLLRWLCVSMLNDIHYFVIFRFCYWTWNANCTYWWINW